MKRYFHRNSGYITLIIAFLLTTIAIASLIISYEFANKAVGESYFQSAMQSYYLARSGLERANYDIIANQLACNSITGGSSYTNATFPNASGQFTVTANAVKVGSVLSSAISATATTIPINSATNFLSNGTVTIDSEVINYASINANTLTNAIRGVGGTVAAAHYSSAPVNQNICVLTSVGGVPNLSTPITKRTIQEILIGNTFSGGNSGSGSSAGSGIFNAAMVIGGNVSLQGNATIINPTVTMQSPSFAGSTILSGGTVSLTSSSLTEVSDGAGGLVVVSNKNGLQADVQQNVSSVNTTNIWNTFFTQSKTTIQASANQTYTSANINGAVGQTIWTNSLSLSGGATIGTLSSPVILIVNGNLDTYSGTTIYGMVYVTGSITVHGSTNITGLFAMEGSIATNGNLTVTYQPSILTLAGNTNTGTNTIYSRIPSSLQEQFI